MTLASRRAREINDYYNHLGEGLGKIVPPQVTSVSRKPLSIALEEIEVGKIIKRDLPTEEELAALAAEAELAAAGRRHPGRRRGLSHPWPRPTSGAVDASSSASPAGSRRTRPSSSAGGMVDAGAHVMPVLTEDATRFIGAVTFSALASEPARTKLFDAGDDPIPHTHLGQTADVVIVAPATAAHDRQVRRRDLRRPAQRHAARDPCARSWSHRRCTPRCGSTRRCRRTSRRCAARGVHVVPPESGRLAGGDDGAGRLAAPEAIMAAVEAVLAHQGDLVGARVLVTAGGTREAIDPVRFIGNRSSGKMGHAVARQAAARGAAVTLVTTTPAEMPAGRRRRAGRRPPRRCTTPCSAATTPPTPSSWPPRSPTSGPRPRPPASSRRPTARPRSCSSRRRTSSPSSAPPSAGQVLVGFAAETDDVAAHAAEKLARKGADLLVANDVSQPDAGFEVDTNRAILLESSGAIETTPLLTKLALADLILDRVAVLLGRGDSPTTQEMR